jgi:AmmeMemoRadiSam system protein B
VKLLVGVLAVTSLLSAAAVMAATVDPVIQELIDKAGLKSTPTERGQMDTVGFVTTAEQMDAVLQQCRALAAPRHQAILNEQGWRDDTPFIAAVCPHDDYYYAGRLYELVMPHIKAKRVVIFGVFHKARYFDTQGRLVFGSFEKWHGPYGPVTVSPLREEIIRRLPELDYMIDNNAQIVEHSVEAIVPFLQAHNRKVEIISILVPYMNWKSMDRISDDLAQAIASLMREKGWRLGEDICLISSADAIHYGDADWGGSNYAEFGTDSTGYQLAVRRDLALAADNLCGPLDRDKLKNFLYSCVDPTDVTQYKITWCGRFSIPLGLGVAFRLVAILENRPLTGYLLDYGTSVGEASLDVEGLGGLGPTAPNNFHHFVGYPAIGYR